MILLGLGSNLGDRHEMLVRAMIALDGGGIFSLQVSDEVETPALLPEGAPAEWDMPYFNLVMTVDTGLSPEELLAAAKRVEQFLGRQDRGRWGPREIDIDILAYNDVVMDTPTLQLPHPGIASRRFVLAPLAEIAPQWRHPVLGKTAAEMLAELA